MKTTIITLGVSLVLASSIARADEARMHVAREASGMRTFAAAPRIVERLQLSPAVMIGAAAEEVVVVVDGDGSTGSTVSPP